MMLRHEYLEARKWRETSRNFYMDQLTPDSYDAEEAEELQLARDQDALQILAQPTRR